MSEIIQDLQWRYATKKFDSDKKVTNEDLEIIKQALRLTPTSLGLMPLRFLIIENPEIRQQLRNASNNQSQITDASHLIVLCSVKHPNEVHVDQHISLTAETRNVEKSSLEGFTNSVNNYLQQRTPEMLHTWTSKQAYIALGILLSVCARLRIDSTPMEGFQPEEYNRILGLDKRNLHATLVCPIGYRHEEDKYQHLAKVRKSHNDLFEVI